MFRTVTLTAVAALLISTTAWAQAQRPHSGTLIIAADSATPLVLKPEDLAAFPRKSVTEQRDGHGVTYEGVLVAELLKRVGAPLGKALRGEALASYVIAFASDGYRVVYSLAELDPEFTNNDVMVVDRINGQPLLPDQGPFRIVAPKDVPGARSIRMLERIEFVRLPKQ